MEYQSPKLSLDLNLPWLGADHKKEPDKFSRDYISLLEDELRKMEVFESVLPLSISILTDALERLKKQAVRNGNFDEIPSTGSEEDADKKSWMSSAQLWNSDRTLSLQLSLNKPSEACEYNDKGGTFLSFGHSPGLSPAKEAVDNNKLALTRPGLYPVTSEPAGLKKGGGGGSGRCGRRSSDPAVADQLKLQFQSQQDLLPVMQLPRKQRRSWSPELHQRFVDALVRLGGPQVATPKQIRELMLVDGLTNDEVKSHLQKYRLHIRKFPKSTTSSSRDKLSLNQDSPIEGSGGSSGVVNGITNLKVELNQSASLEGPFQFAMGSAKSNSPASRCDSMEDDYEGKSDSQSWEGD